MKPLPVVHYILQHISVTSQSRDYSHIPLMTHQKTRNYEEKTWNYEETYVGYNLTICTIKGPL